MCGIAGLLSLNSRSPNLDLLQRMIRIQRHRGPDGQGFFLEDQIGLAHARLSIIDVEGGHQPMSLLDAGLTISFNGEIFNYIELRKELEAKGHRFASHSDTEVILHLYQEYGPQALDRMNGQWAFAIWDSRRKALFLSRDRAGIRPLFYTIQGNFFAFASEVKGLLALPFVRRNIDPISLAETFIFWHPLPPRSIFEEINELQPGHNLTIGLDNLRPNIQRYWQIRYCEEKPGRKDEYYVGELIALLSDATRIMLRADVPVGAYLSGGLDSSVTTSLIRRNSDALLKTFSVTFNDPNFDESEYQREVAAFLGTDHVAVSCSYNDIARVFPNVIWHAEQPVVRTAPAPLYILSKLVRDWGFKVVLTGEGSDEVFGGYDIFKEAKIRYFWGRRPDSKTRPLLLKKLYPYMDNIQSQPLDYLKAFFHVSPEVLGSPLFSHLPRWELGKRNLIFLSDDFKTRLATHDPIADLESLLPREFESWDWFSRAQYLEFSFLMPAYILSAQGDRMALAHSIESRFPFLDHRLIEFGSRLPLRLRMNGLAEKYLLKRAAKGLIPESVLHRKKQPYRAPDSQSFIGPGIVGQEYVSSVLSPESLKSSGLFNPAAVSLLLKKARQGQLTSVRDNMAFVGILSSQLLMEQFIKSLRPMDA